MSDLTGPVEVVGTGLLGTSIGLALTRSGVDVLLQDVSPENVRTASGLGAGRPAIAVDQPNLVVVAVPPDHGPDLAPAEAVPCPAVGGGDDNTNPLPALTTDGPCRLP